MGELSESFLRHCLAHGVDSEPVVPVLHATLWNQCSPIDQGQKFAVLEMKLHSNVLLGN
jgi:hypothetical protein